MFFKKAVLIVHGFAGGVYDQEYLSNYLELNWQFDVFTFTLPGHDRTSIGNKDYKSWIDKSEEQVKYLLDNGYKNIYVIGHSMGGVIATYLASKYSCIKKLVLVAPAFSCFAFENNKFNFIKGLKKLPGLSKQYTFEEIFHRIVKMPAPAIKSFMTLIETYHDTPSKVSCPTLIVQGLDDKVVPKDSSEYAFDNLNTNNKKLYYVNGITHDVFRSDKTKEISYIVFKFLKTHKKYNNDKETI